STVVADYDEGCQLMITATMISSYPIEEVIRGRLGTIKFVRGGFQIIGDDPSKGAGIPARLEKSLEAAEMCKVEAPPADTRDVGKAFLTCARDGKRETLSTPELGAAAFTTVAMGVQSYRTGKVLFWDREARKVSEADDSWARQWEQRSKKR